MTGKRLNMPAGEEGDKILHPIRSIKEVAMSLSRRHFLLLSAAAALPARAATIPRPATPDFSINLPNGSKLPLKQFRGKVVAMTFINTNCPHCQEVTKALTEIQKEYGPKGVQVVMSAMDDNAAVHVPVFIQRFRPSYPVGWNDRDAALDFLQIPVMVPGYVPKMAFIDREGVIRAQYAGEDAFFKTPAASIRAEIDKMLKSAAPARKKSTRKKQ
ncbi:MAG TPA: TlpA disulfide reductase family protein [Bryobacteraceae bacterium]|nr:TlpA disulfide reductase family protein [Bryobacteraceae bacterium]